MRKILKEEAQDYSQIFQQALNHGDVRLGEIYDISDEGNISQITCDLESTNFTWHMYLDVDSRTSKIISASGYPWTDTGESAQFEFGLDNNSLRILNSILEDDINESIDEWGW